MKATKDLTNANQVQTTRNSTPPMKPRTPAANTGYTRNSQDHSSIKKTKSRKETPALQDQMQTQGHNPTRSTAASQAMAPIAPAEIRRAFQAANKTTKNLQNQISELESKVNELSKLVEIMMESHDNKPPLKKRKQPIQDQGSEPLWNE